MDCKIGKEKRYETGKTSLLECTASDLCISLDAHGWGQLSGLHIKQSRRGSHGTLLPDVGSLWLCAHSCYVGYQSRCYTACCGCGRRKPPRSSPACHAPCNCLCPDVRHARIRSPCRRCALDRRKMATRHPYDHLSSSVCHHPSPHCDLLCAQRLFRCHPTGL